MSDIFTKYEKTLGITKNFWKFQDKFCLLSTPDEATKRKVPV